MERIDHIEAMRARLLTLWDDAVTLRAILEALMAPAFDLESSLQAMRLRTIETAQGVQLDDIGALVLFPRAGRTDETYRLWLNARLLVLRGAGRSEDLIKIVKLLQPSASAVDVVSMAPSTIIVESEGVTIGPTLRDILRSAKGAGIALDLVWTETSGDALIFGDYLEAEADTVHGIGDETNPATGGVLASI